MLREFTYSGKIHCIEPITIVDNFRLFEIEYTSKFFDEDFSIRTSLLSQKHRTLRIFITRITDLSCRVTNNNDNLMTELLKLFELQNRNHMSKMDNRS